MHCTFRSLDRVSILFIFLNIVCVSYFRTLAWFSPCRYGLFLSALVSMGHISSSRMGVVCEQYQLLVQLLAKLGIEGDFLVSSSRVHPIEALQIDTSSDQSKRCRREIPLLEYEIWTKISYAWVSLFRLDLPIYTFWYHFLHWLWQFALAYQWHVMSHRPLFLSSYKNSTGGSQSTLSHSHIAENRLNGTVSRILALWNIS